MSNKNSDYYFLRGGGEMGELIRAKDWRKTSLGDPAEWPQSLQTMVAMMLDNPFGMYIAWGSEYIQIYNDGYRPILGATKHPQALGISTRETFSEIWHIIESMFDGVMKGKAVGFPDFMLPLNRNGFLEECYFDFSYSPIRKDNGEVGGVLVTVIETTDKKKVQAALIESTDQLKFAMDAAELGTWDYDPATNKFKANSRLKTWFGLSESEQIELHHATDAIAEKDKDRIIAAIKKVLDYSSGGIYEEEYSIINPLTNKEIIVQGKGRAWFNEDRIAYRFTGVLQEVTEKVLSRKSIEESEARFRAIADDAPVFIFLAGENAEVEYLNKTWRDYTGISTNDYKGRAWAEITHPDDVDPATKIYMDGFNKRESCSFENRQKGIDGMYRTILWKATPRFCPNGEFIGMMGVGLDIHERKKSEGKLRESELKVRALVENAPFPIAVYVGKEMIVELANQSILDIWGKGNDVIGKSFKEVLPELDNQLVFTQIQKVLETGESFHSKNTPIDLIIDGKPYTYYFNYSFTPLYDISDNIYGVMNTASDVTDLNLVKKKIEESESNLKLMIHQAPVAIAIMRDADYTVEIANKHALELWGRTEQQVLGKSVFTSMPELLAQGFKELLDGVRDTGKRFSSAEMPVQLFRNGIMETIYVNFSYEPLYDADAKINGIMTVGIDVTQEVVARKKVELNEEKLNIVIEASELGTYELNLKTSEPKYSKRYLEILGGYKDEITLTHEQLIQHLHPDDFSIREKAFKDAIDTGYLHYEARLIWKDKSVHWMEGRGKVFYDEEGNPEKLIGTIRDITEEKNYEAELRKSEEQFSTLADNMENLAWLADGEGWRYWYNKRWYDYTGTKLEEMKGWGWTKVHHPEHLERVVDFVKHAWQKGEPWELTFPLRRHDGEYRWFLTRGYPVTNEEGKITRWIGTSTDIDEQKKAEEKFKMLADQAPMWVWLTDTEVNIEYTNPEVLKFVGIAHYTEFTGKMWEQIVHPEDIGMVYHSFGEAVSLQQSFSFDFRVLNASTQQYEWFYIKAVPRMESGAFTGFIGTGININEQRLNLSQLEYRKTLLEAHNESSLDGILLVDTKGRIISYNHRFVEIWNMPPQIAKGKDDEEALKFAVKQLVNPEKFMERVRWMYENPKEISIDELEFKDGKIIERYGYHVSGADGSYFGCSWMFRDITKQRKSERAVKESEEKFRLLADSMPQHIWTADLQGNLNYYNQSVFDYSGLTQDQINKDGWIQIVHPDDREENIEKWLNSVTTGKDFLFEHRFRRHDGEYRWQLSRAIPQRDETGKIQMWVGTSTDIQEQKTFANALEEQVNTRTAELKASEEKFYNLFNLSPICKTLSDVGTGKIVMVNDAFTRLFGYSREEALHKSSAEMGLLDLEARASMITELKANGKIVNMELGFIKKSGERFVALASSEVITMGDKQFFLSAFNDISEIKRAEQHIKQKNIELEIKTIQLEEAQQLAHIGSWEWDVVSNKIEWSDELFRIFGLSPQEFKADYENYLKYIHPDDREYVNSIVQQALKDHQPYSLFHKVAGADGKIRILSATGKVITDGDGNVTRMSGTAQDVTAQKNYEEELKISEERFYKIFDSNPVPMSLSEIGNSKIKYANNRFYNTFGYSKEEVIGRSSEELNLLDPEENKRLVNLIFGYLLENRPLAEVQALSKEEKEALLLKLKQSEKMKDFEILYTRKNGEKFPALVFYEVIRIGFDSYTVTSYQDITERKKAEALLRSQNDQLEKMNKELESFAYISSHDLQEPLRKIQTFASRITEKEAHNLSDIGNDMLNRMKDAAQRMQTLIQDLLAYSRTNTTERKLKTIDLNEIIAEVKEDLKEELNEKHATIETNQLCEADIIHFQFRQLMHNLIGNSLKFSNPENPPYIQIKSEIAKGIKFNNEKLSPQKKYCHISVSDNGIGFEQQYCEKIFEVFQRLHGKDAYNGTGIGLSIVKKIVENHHGIITAKGELNKGATFDIYIPAT